MLSAQVAAVVDLSSQQVGTVIVLRDISDPGHYTEQIVDESWTEHLRRFDRVTGADIALRERKLAFHLEEAPPRVTRYAIDTPRT